MALLAVAACDRPATIAVPVDPLVVNSTQAVAIAAAAVSDSGDTVRARLRYSVADSSVATVTPDGRLTCRRRGVTTLRLVTGAIGRGVELRCRPIRAFGFASFATPLRFAPGDPPRAIAVEAFGDSGREHELRARVHVEHPTVASVHGGVVTPLAPGRTVVGSDFGHIAHRQSVEVHERVVAERVTIRDGAAPVWRLGPGLYELTLRALRGRLRWHATGTACAPVPRSAAGAISCIVKTDAVVTVRPGDTARVVTGEVVILRLPPYGRMGPASAP